jgi:hypothetical protein
MSKRPGRAYYEVASQIFPVLLLAASLEASIFRLHLADVAASLTLPHYWTTRRDRMEKRRHVRWIPRLKVWRRLSMQLALAALTLLSPWHSPNSPL